jgi:hypothetical protein
VAQNSIFYARLQMLSSLNIDAAAGNRDTEKVCLLKKSGGQLGRASPWRARQNSGRITISSIFMLLPPAEWLSSSCSMGFGGALLEHFSLFCSRSIRAGQSRSW